MKTITYDDFVSFDPCWLRGEENREKHEEQLARYRAMRDEWTALDILRLDEVSADDRLWLVLREQLIDAPILHEFACRCAERALSRVREPDKRSVAAIEAKRKWLRGECTDAELAAARDAAMSAARSAEMSAAMAAEMDAEWDAARSPAWCAAWYAAKSATWSAEWAAARSSAWYAAMSAAMSAARSAAWDAERSAAMDAEREWQVAELVRMLEGENDD